MQMLNKQKLRLINKEKLTRKMLLLLSKKPQDKLNLMSWLKLKQQDLRKLLKKKKQLEKMQLRRKWKLKKNLKQKLLLLVKEKEKLRLLR